MSGAWEISEEELAYLREEARKHREKRPWHVPLIEKGDERWWCCITSTLFCCAAGFVQSRLERDQPKSRCGKCFSGFGAFSVLYSLCIPYAPLMMLNLRTRYRQAQVVEGDWKEDWKAACLCAPCAASQMLRDYDNEEELQKSNFDDAEIIRAHAARKAREKEERDKLRREKLSARAKLVIEAAFSLKKKKKHRSSSRGNTARSARSGTEDGASSSRRGSQAGLARKHSRSDLQRMTSKANIYVEKKKTPDPGGKASSEPNTARSAKDAAAEAERMAAEVAAELIAAGIGKSGADRAAGEVGPAERVEADKSHQDGEQGHDQNINHRDGDQPHPSVPQDSQQRLDLPNVDVVVSGADNAESGADAMQQADDALQNQTNPAPTGTSDQPRGVCAAICEPDRSKPAAGATGKGGACVLM